MMMMMMMMTMLLLQRYEYFIVFCTAGWGSVEFSFFWTCSRTSAIWLASRRTCTSITRTCWTRTAVRYTSTTPSKTTTLSRNISEKFVTHIFDYVLSPVLDVFSSAPSLFAPEPIRSLEFSLPGTFANVLENFRSHIVNPTVSWSICYENIYRGLITDPL